MVHRPPDSRLLANLINHEKDYTKHLTALFPLSHAALAALSAYAAASPSSHPASPAHTIAAIVDVLASADDAFQRYTQAIDAWREQLVALKVLEDDLSAILRDRDILVTRLIKASKSTRDAHRSSRLIAPLSSLGSASNSSLPSTVSLSGHSPANTNPKLAEAQAELQACEAHLAAKEHELDARRITLARDGLGARCRALIDCGWVWGEIGKQGLKVLSGDGSGDGSNLSAPKPSRAIPSRQNANTNPTMSASDNSSLTPSQSASQTVARSVETSHSGLTSKEHEHLQPDEKQETTTTTFKSQARPVRASDDLTITLPPAYAISELALPTGVLAQSPSPDNGHSTPTPNAGTQPAPALIRKRTKRSRRPISQHITEASHEDSDGPSSVSNRNATASPRVPHTPFPNTRIPANDTSSDDEQPTGPLQVVENDPFEVIRRSMLGPTGASASPLLAGTAPTARASAPDVRASASYDTSPSKIMFPAPVSGHGQSGGIGMGLPSTSQASPKRQRRTSLLFGSLRGLFRKPKERGRVGADWDDGHLSPSPSSNLTRAKTSGGWVTRTDARVKGRRGEDSDEEAMSKEVRRRKTTATATATTMTTNEANLGRSASRARLRKGRPGASNGTSVAPSHRAGVDGWITDSPGGAGAGTVTASGSGVGAGAGPSRSRTRRGTMKRKKISVAELRGNDQGHTDGEVDGAHQPLERMASTVRGKAPEATVSRPIAEVQEEKQVAVPTNPNPTAEPNVSVSPGTQPRRATTTTATSSRKPSSDAALAHRRSASMSYVDAQLATVVASTSTQAMPMSTSTGGSMSWRKPPPQIEPQSQQVSPSQAQSQSLTRSPSQAQAQPSSRTYESQPKPNARRHLGNGHAKHAQNQSLMSIVADVTRQDEDQALVMDKARSLDIPRAPGSVLRDQYVGGAQRGGMNGAGHGRTTSEDVGAGQAQAQAQRDIKMPLRSALRNASRTPSPSPATVPAIVPAGQVRKEAGVEEQRGRGSGSVSPPWRDSASISSYETGRESWDGEPSSPVRSQSRSPVVRSQSQPPAIRRAQSPVLINHVDARPSTRSRSPSPPPFTFPPPPVDPPPVRPSNMHSHSNSLSNLNGNRASNGTEHGNDPPSSTVSTETPPVRRKSVRVSLQPTFSPTPPALNDEEGDDDGGGAGERYAPWNGRDPLKTNTKTTTGDVWADSSEEDEVYKRARRLLSLVGRGRT